jgi:hypothetical protein
MTTENFNRFKYLVLADLELQGELSAIDDRGRFVDRVVELANERGVPIERADVDEALLAARRSWTDRWA